MNRMRAAGLILLAALLAGAWGCGTPLPPPADPERAKTALREALEAWKNGATAESLKGRVPPIHVNDRQWKDGRRLTAYEVESEEASGLSWRAVVRLTVQAADGEPREQTARYAVDTSPAIVIVREP